MISIRLPIDMENKLNNISKQEHITKTEIIRKAIQNYLNEYFESVNPYEAGKDLFGKYGSGESDNSKNYKSKIKDKIRAKHTH